MMTGEDIKKKVHSDLLRCRNLYTVVTSPDFDEALVKADDFERKMIEEAVVSSDSAEIKRIVRIILIKDFEAKTIRDLRRMGQRYRIPGYNRLAKEALVLAIKEKQDEYARRNTSKNDTASSEGGCRSEETS